MKKAKSNLKGMSELLEKWQFSTDREKSKKYVKHEFQDYGVRLAMNLNDEAHKSLYIKLAKNDDRVMLEKAYRFAIDYPGMDGRNKGRLFMWAMAKLRRGEQLYDKKRFDTTKNEQNTDYRKQRTE